MTTKEKYASRFEHDNIPLSDIVLVEMMKIELIKDANELQEKHNKLVLKEVKKMKEAILSIVDVSTIIDLTTQLKLEEDANA